MADFEKTVLLKVELDVDQLTRSANEAEEALADLIPQQQKLKSEAKQNTVEYKELELEIRKYKKQLTDSVKAIQANERAQENQTGSLQEMRDQLSAAKIAYAQLSAEQRDTAAGQAQLQQMNALNEELKELEAAYGSHGRSVGDYEKATRALTDTFEEVYGEGAQPLTSRLGELEDRMYELVLAGEATGQEFGELQAEAVKLRKTVIQTDAAVDQLAESGGAMGTAISAAEGLTQAYQAGLSVTALMGVEQEEMLEVLTKLEAVQGLLNSLEAVRITLQKNSIRITRLQAGAQRLLNTAIGNGTVAAKGFRAALLATGVGALVVGIIALIQNFDELKEMVVSTNREQEAYNETLQSAVDAGASAFEQVNKVGNAFAMAKEGVISKEEALNTYNETLGKSLGAAETLEEAEQNYIDKTEAYIKSTMRRAQAQELFKKAAEEQAKFIEAQLSDQTTNTQKFFAGITGAFETAAQGSLDFNDLMTNVTESTGEAMEKAEEESKSLAQERFNTFSKLGADMLRQAEIAEEANGIISEDEAKLAAERKRRAEEWKKREEEKLAKAKEVAEKIRDLQLSNQDIGLANERAALEAHYEFLETIAANNARQLAEIQTEKNAALDELSQRELEASIAAVEEKYQREFEAAEGNAELIVELERNKNLEIDALNNERAAQISQREIERIAEEQAFNQERIENSKAAANELKLIDAELHLERMRGTSEEFNAWKALQDERINQVEIARDAQLSNVELTESERVRITRQAELEIQQIQNETFEQNKAQNEQKVQDQRALATSALSSAQQLSDALFQIEQNRIQSEINLLQRKHDTATQLLQDELDAGLITQAEFNAESTKLQAQFEAEQSKLKQEQFRKNKAAQLINATIATAVGVANALNAPPPLSFILAGVAGALGAAQIAIIASQPTPEFEDGGQAPLKNGVFAGKRHSQGGTKGVFSDGTKVEVEKDEAFFILNRRATAQIGALSNHNVAHGGRSFYQSGGVVKFQDGGAFAQNVSQNVEDRYQQANDFEQIARALPNPVVFVDDINNGQRNVARVANRGDV